MSSNPTEDQDERLRGRVLVPEDRPPVPPVPPSRAEKRQIKAARRRLQAAPPPTELRVGETAWAQPILGLPHTDERGWRAQISAAFGTASGPFVDAEINRLLAVLKACRDDLPLEMKVNAAIALIEGVAPRNEAEALLAVQMAVSHVLAMHILTDVARLHPVGASAEMTAAGNLAAKLMRTFGGHVEALAKLRRPADQVVRVERVNVSAGGQAIVGPVSQTTISRGAAENGTQPYGTEHAGAGQPASDSPMRGEAARRLPVPEAASQGPEPLPPARRGSRNRRSEG